MGCSTACLALAVVRTAVVAKPVAVLLPPLAAMMDAPIVVIRVAIPVARPTTRAGAVGGVDHFRTCGGVVATIVATMVAIASQPFSEDEVVATTYVRTAVRATLAVSARLAVTATLVTGDGVLPGTGVPAVVVVEKAFGTVAGWTGCSEEAVVVVGRRPVATLAASGTTAVNQTAVAPPIPTRAATIRCRLPRLSILPPTKRRASLR